VQIFRFLTKEIPFEFLKIPHVIFFTFMGIFEIQGKALLTVYAA